MSIHDTLTALGIVVPVGLTVLLQLVALAYLFGSLKNKVENIEKIVSNGLSKKVDTLEDKVSVLDSRCQERWARMHREEVV